MKKWTLATLWAAMITALTTVPAFADLIIPGQPRQPSPAPEPTPVPAPESTPDATLITVLIVAVAVIAAAVIIWMVIRCRRMRQAV